MFWSIRAVGRIPRQTYDDILRSYCDFTIWLYLRMTVYRRRLQCSNCNAAGSAPQASLVNSLVHFLRARTLRTHAVQVLHRQEVDVEEAIHAVCETCLFALIQFRSPDRTANALLPADFRERVGLYRGLPSQLLFLCRNRASLQPFCACISPTSPTR